MMNTQRLVVICATMLSMGLMAGPTSAQEPALIRITGDWIPTSDRSSPVGQPDTPASEAEASTRTLSASVNIPIRLTEHALLMPGASYSLLSVSGTNIGIPADRDLHAVSVSALFHYRLTPRWNVTLSVAPTLSGDFVDVNGDHFRFAGSALASYAFSDRFTLGAGLLVSWQFGEPLPLPAIRMQWKILEQLRFQALLPSHAELVWRPHDRFEVGVSASVRGQLYAITAPSVRERWPCQAETVDDPDTPDFDERDADPEACTSSLAYARGEIGTTISVRVASSLWLSARAGFAFFRRYELQNADGETPDGGDLSLEPNVLVQAQLTLRIPGT